MTSGAASTETGSNRGALALAIAMVGAWLWSWWQLVSQPETVLVANVLVDDALYFALPARHLVEGHGFSFDGIELTNGVQTLWALVCVVLAAVFAEPLTMLRAMVGVSGLCWFAAAWGLFACLRSRSVGAATLTAVGFAWLGVHDRLAFMGMENGLHALVSVLVLLAGRRAVRRSWSPGAVLLLGSTLALFGLSRTEGVLLGPLIGLPLVFGWLGAPGGFARRVRAALLLALPGVVLVGGACLLSKLWFDSFLPISGSVKQLYESSWGGYDDPKHEASGRRGVFGMVRWHLQFVTRLVLAPLRVHVPDLLGDVTMLGHRVFRNLVWVGLGVGGLLAIRRWWRRRKRRGEHGGEPVVGAPVYWCFGAYAVVHVVLMGLSLSHFTSYGKWYFASEAVALWLVIGLAFAGFGERFARWLPVVAVFVAIAGLRDGGGVTTDVRTSEFKRAGEWLRDHTPPGTVIGALSSGLVGWYASEQHVVNLDGLINNRRYLDDFLEPRRFAEYFADRGITWFADYQPIAGWKNGISWRGNVPASRLVPHSYRRLSGEHAYVIWQVLPAGATFELLGEHGPPVRDRLAELMVAADVHGRFPVVPADQAANHPDLVAAHTFDDGEGGRLSVMLTREQIEAFGLSGLDSTGANGTAGGR